MKPFVFRQLFRSFLDLGHAIDAAKKVAGERKGADSELMHRLNSYEEMLEKQKALAERLYRRASAGDWEEVSRLLKLISNLSKMIRDDAREVIASSRDQHGAVATRGVLQ